MVSLLLVAYFTVRSINKQTLHDTINEGIINRKKERKIHCLKHSDLTGFMVRKFMFNKKRKLAGILFSLALGGSIFLCTTYMDENLKIHAEMSLQSYDGLNSEYRIALKSDSLSDNIPQDVVTNIKNISGLKDVYATKYTLGEIEIKKDELTWTNYFKEQNREYGIQRDYGGICVENESGSFDIKYDIYGYDEGMLSALKQYILEGEINPIELYEKNKIIVVANKDGQGNYDFYGKHQGDIIQLKVPKSQQCSKEVLKFQSPDEEYVTINVEIAAIVSRAMAKEENFLIRDVWKTAPSIIMTNEQMVDNFGIESYNNISISPEQQSNTDIITRELLAAIQDVPKAVLQDYTTAIETQKSYLRQQQLFFSGIAGILLIISLFHILNSMNFSVLARRHEFGIIRAMGITDTGLYKMILKDSIVAEIRR